MALPSGPGSSAAELLFSALDADGDGVITRDEMRAGLQTGQSPPRGSPGAGGGAESAFRKASQASHHRPPPMSSFGASVSPVSAAGTHHLLMMEQQRSISPTLASVAGTSLSGSPRHRDSPRQLALEGDVDRLGQELHMCRLALAKAKAESERMKLVLESEREEGNLRREGAAAAASQQVARSEARAAAARSEADASNAALSAANARLRETDGWREKANAREQSLGVAQHAHRVAEASHGRALSESQALQAQVDTAREAHHQQLVDHTETVRGERHSRELAEQQVLDLTRSRDASERTVGGLQERLGQAQQAHAEALADISALRASLTHATEAAHKDEVDARAWEERAHAAVAETVARGQHGLAAGSGTVALLTSEVASAKQLLHAERAAKAELAAELATERHRLGKALEQAKAEGGVAMIKVAVAREEAEDNARAAAEHIHQGMASRQDSAAAINALRAELAEARSEAGRNAAAVSSTTAEASVNQTRVESESADLRRCLRVVEATVRLHAEEASALEIRHGELEHKLAKATSTHEASEDELTMLTRANAKLQEQLKKMIAESRRKDAELTAAEARVTQARAEHEATKTKLTAEIQTKEKTVATAADDRAAKERALLEAEGRLAKLEQARVASEQTATAALEQAAAVANESASARVAELSDRVMRLHDELHAVHTATTQVTAEHVSSVRDAEEQSALWRRRAVEAEAAESLMKAQVEQFARETASERAVGREAEQSASRDVTVWRERAEAAVAEAAAAHSELGEFGAELVSLHSLHKLSVSVHREEGERLSTEASTQGMRAQQGADAVAQLESELRFSEERATLMERRVEQSSQLAVALEMRAAEAEALDLRRRTEATADARKLAEQLTGQLSMRRLPEKSARVGVSPERSFLGSRQRARAAAPPRSRGGQVKRSSPGLSSAAAEVSGTIGQHLTRHHSSSWQRGGAAPAASPFDRDSELASLLASPATSTSSYGRAHANSSPAQSDNETTIGVLSMLDGLGI